MLHGTDFYIKHNWSAMAFNGGRAPGPTGAASTLSKSVSKQVTSLFLSAG